MINKADIGGLHCKKRLATFPSPAGILPNSPWAGIIKLLPPRVSDIPAVDGNVAKLFLQCTYIYMYVECSILPCRDGPITYMDKKDVPIAVLIGKSGIHKTA
jgi:hypothetical protein